MNPAYDAARAIAKALAEATYVDPQARTVRLYHAAPAALMSRLARETSKDTGTCNELHTPQPTGYMSWHHWARRMTKTHRQLRCPNCSRFEIWVARG